MRTSSKLKNWEIALLLALCVTLLTGVWAQARQARLASGLIRLHVIAVSDDDVEQAVKLRVRDAVLAYLSPALDGAADAGAAKTILTQNLSGIRGAAESAAGRASFFHAFARHRAATKKSRYVRISHHFI